MQQWSVEASSVMWKDTAKGNPWDGCVSRKNPRANYATAWKGACEKEEMTLCVVSDKFIRYTDFKYLKGNKENFISNKLIWVQVMRLQMLSFPPFWPLWNSVILIKLNVDLYFKDSLVFVLEELLVYWDRTIIKRNMLFAWEKLKCSGKTLEIQFCTYWILVKSDEP